ncbi:unnamed protein product, partial [Mesorhabditis belari]|uniref:Uncharacterized protein n=1 Tax=Mesorhabditis belari TaxID=2138241 RepID=A0AAF3JAP9_9BILA
MEIQVLTTEPRRKHEEKFRIPFWTWIKLLLFVGLISLHIAEIVYYRELDTFLERALRIISIVAILFAISSLLFGATRRHNFIVALFSIIILIFDSAFVYYRISTFESLFFKDFIRLFLWFGLNYLQSVDHERPKEEASSFDRAGCFSICTFSWLSKLMSRGFKMPLEMVDLHNLPQKETSETLREKWNDAWKDEQMKHPQKISLTRALFCGLSTEPLFVLLLKSITQLIQFFIVPHLLKWLLGSLSEKEIPLSFPLLCAIGLFINLEAISLLTGFFMFLINRYQLHIQTMFLNACYEKLLRLSPIARSKYSVGLMVNLMSIDIDKVADFFPASIDLISMPLKIIFGTAMLTILLGTPGLSVLVIVCLIIVFNVFVTKLIKKYQQQQMKIKDERTKMCNEVFHGIKLIKLYAWEEAFEERIGELRAQEVTMIKRVNIISQINLAVIEASIFIMILVVFGLCIWTLEEGHDLLRPEIVFVAISILQQLKTPMRKIAKTVTFLVQAQVSLKRLKDFLLEDEIEDKDYDSKRRKSTALSIKDGEFTWMTSLENPSLSSINLKIKKGTSIGIVGEVGSGKSSLLTTFLGEIHQMNGKMKGNGIISYVPQQPWIISTTIRKNIILEKQFNRQRYEMVISATELKDDFEKMKFGDLTELGENGVTLSGGQKARVGLARALYQDGDIFLFDDIFSAVDVQVGKKIFDKCLSSTGILEGKTRVLVTHGIKYAKECDQIILMNNGQIRKIGIYSELENDEVFKKLLHQSSDSSTNGFSNKNSENDEDEDEIIPKKESVIKGEDFGRIIQKENAETGRVKNKIYLSYFRLMPLLLIIFLIYGQIFSTGFSVWRALWLADWSTESQHGISKDDTKFRFFGFTFLGALEVFFLTFSFISLIIGCQKVSLKIHYPFLHAVLRSPMAFFDTTPIGRILNRFSKDLDSIDNKSPKSLSEILQRVADVVSNAIRICLAIPPLLVLIAPFFLLNFLYLRFYLRGARQLNRLSSLQRSLLIAKFRETIQGVTSIRVFKMVNSEIAEFSRFVDGVTICNFASFGSSRWLEIRLELLSNSTIFLVALFGILMSRASAISPALLGLCITSAMAITERLYLGIKAFGHLETEAVSIERIYEYTKLPSEKPWKNDFEPPRNWPQNGGIIWSDYSAKYRPNLSLSLKNVNVSVKPGEKIAVIGRTGSGKSSLSLSLYRIFESAAGRILIDDIDISTLGLHDIRKKLTIIPQDPILFSGTIRFNLDPFKKFDDEKIWEALEKCQLKKCFAESAEKLEYKIEEGGNNMSMGQRQLICLGRALLRKTKILILDEATASCDPNTDRLIQEVIRRNFADSSVLTIAHRLETVSDYDKVMVFSHGEIVEFDQAERLLANPDSFYTKMLRSYYRSE